MTPIAAFWYDPSEAQGSTQTPSKVKPLAAVDNFATSGGEIKEKHWPLVVENANRYASGEISRQEWEKEIERLEKLESFERLFRSVRG